jgi:hypothetical protein
LLPAPLDFNREHLELLYRALGRGLVVWQYIEGTLYLSAFAASGISHADCATKFYGFTGAGGRLAFTDRALKATLDPVAYDHSWRPLHDELKTFITYRNSLAHFEVYHIADHAGLAAEPSTKYNVLLSEST